MSFLDQPSRARPSACLGADLGGRQDLHLVHGYRLKGERGLGFRGLGFFVVVGRAFFRLGLGV